MLFITRCIHLALDTALPTQNGKIIFKTLCFKCTLWHNVILTFGNIHFLLLNKCKTFTSFHKKETQEFGMYAKILAKCSHLVILS